MTPALARLSVGCAVAALGLACSRDPTAATGPVEVEVHRGSLTLRWEARAALQASRQETIRSATEGEVAILYLAPHDSFVEAGEKVAELDASRLDERRIEFATERERSRRAVADAEVALRVHAAESNAALAELEGALLSARFDLDTHHGRSVTLAEATQERDRNNWAAAVDDARLALEAAQGAADRKLARLEAELLGARRVFDVVSEQLARCEARIEATVVRAPFAGLVSRELQDEGRPVLDIGSLVRERQPLLELRDKSIVTRVRIPATIGDVAVGTAAAVRVDAYPDQVLVGRVDGVGPLAAPDSSRRSSTYREVEISVDAATEISLLPGMSARITVDGAHIEDAVHVPVAAIRTEHGEPRALKVTPEGPVPTPVTIGRFDAENVEILDGLTAGDRVLVPPTNG